MSQHNNDEARIVLCDTLLSITLTLQLSWERRACSEAYWLGNHLEST